MTAGRKASKINYNKENRMRKAGNDKFQEHNRTANISKRLEKCIIVIIKLESDFVA